MTKRIIYVEGVDGQVELMSDRVVIHRKGLFCALRFGFGSKREIPLGAIAEVNFRDSNLLVMGKIEFIRAGRSQEEKITKDYSSVKFRMRDQQKFERLKETVFQMVDQFLLS